MTEDNNVTRPPRKRSTDPETIAKRRQAALDALPRIGVNVIQDRPRMIRLVEDLAMELGDNVKVRQEKGDPYWWNSQDMLDDMLDILDALKRGV